MMSSVDTTWIKASWPTRCSPSSARVRYAVRGDRTPGHAVRPTTEDEQRGLGGQAPAHGARRALKQVAEPFHAGAPPPAPSGAPRAVRLQQFDAREHALEPPGARRPGGIDRALDSCGQGLAARDLFPARRAARQVRGHRVAVPDLERTVTYQSTNSATWR